MSKCIDWFIINWFHLLFHRLVTCFRTWWQSELWSWLIKHYIFFVATQQVASLGEWFSQSLPLLLPSSSSSSSSSSCSSSPCWSCCIILKMVGGNGEQHRKNVNLCSTLSLQPIKWNCRQWSQIRPRIHSRKNKHSIYFCYKKKNWRGFRLKTGHIKVVTLCKSIEILICMQPPTSEVKPKSTPNTNQ